MLKQAYNFVTIGSRPYEQFSFCNMSDWKFSEYSYSNKAPYFLGRPTFQGLSGSSAVHHTNIDQGIHFQNLTCVEVRANKQFALTSTQGSTRI